MEISQRLLGLLFTLSVLTGCGLGCVSELLGLLRALSGADRPPRRLRSSRPAARFVRAVLRGAKKAALFLADVSFGLLCGVALILLLYYVNDGGFRLIAVVGMAAGCFVWRHTLGRLTRRAAAGLHRFRKNKIQRKADAAYERDRRT